MYNFTEKFPFKRGWRSLALLIMCISFTTVALAQQPEKKLDITLRQAPLSALISQIESQTGYVVNIVKEEVDLATSVTVDVKQGTVRDVLNVALKGTNYSYQIENDVIIINRNPVIKASNNKVIGQVLDARDNSPIIGATIKIGNTGTITDVKGEYALDLPYGTYSLTISSIGYTSKRIDEVIIKGKDPLVLNITLSTQKGTLRGIEVVASARRETISALYTRQKNNAAITDGISADIIGRTPDKNIGEVLKRISGVAMVDNRYVVVRGLSERYNQTMLNGQVMPSTELNRKNFSFDIVPANVVENVTIYKTLTPDQSAEFGGGIVAIKTMDIPNENFLNINIGGSFNDNTTGKNFRSLKLTGSEMWAQRADHRNLLGSFDWKSTQEITEKFEGMGKLSSSFSNNWGVYETDARPSQNYAASIGRIFNTRSTSKLGIIASLSYRNTLATQDIRMNRDGFGGQVTTPDSTNYSGKRYGLTTNIAGLFGAGFRNKNSSISFQSLYLQTLDQQLIIGTGWHISPDAYMLGYYDLTTQTNLWQSQLKGEHLLGKNKLKLNWSGSYIRLDRQKPDNHNLKARLLDDNSLKSNEFNIGSAMSSGINRGALRWWNRALEDTYNWEASLSIPFNFISGKSNLKLGYTGWYKDRLFYVLNTGTSPTDLSTFPTIAKAFEPSNTTIELGRTGDDFNKDASLHAMYAMFDNRIGEKWRLVWGLRAEYYNLNRINSVLDSLFVKINSGRPNPDDQFDYSALENREPNWNFFPSANLTYSLTPQMNLRLAYSKSIIRPDLRELSFFQEYDFELGGLYTSELVKSTTIDHLDFRYEWYPGAGEVISFSLFYKNNKYPMEIYKRGDNREYYLTNNKSAKNYGLEVEARKSLAFTKVPLIRNITLYGNFTILDTKIIPMTVSFNHFAADDPLKIEPEEVLGPEEKRPQTGASNFMLNAGLFYDMKPFSASFTYNYVTTRMFRPSNVYAASLFERPMESLDAQLAIGLLEGKGVIKLNASNILNSFSLVYQNVYNGLGSPEGNRAPTRKELRYNVKDDMIDYEAKPGRTFSISFGYNF